VRGSLIPINIAFNAFVVHYGMITSGYIMMVILNAYIAVLVKSAKRNFWQGFELLKKKRG
jgi:putative MFS transporter